MREIYLILKLFCFLILNNFVHEKKNGFAERSKILVGQITKINLNYQNNYVERSN